MNKEFNPGLPPSETKITRFLDFVTGTNRAKSKILEIIDEQKTEITDRTILRHIHNTPGDLLVSDAGIRRALKLLEEEGIITRRFINSEQAAENNTNFGNNYTRVKSQIS